MQILHITAHMGGGVGRAISSLVKAEKKNKHIVFLLQSPEKFQYIEQCREAGVVVYTSGKTEDIFSIMKWMDVVILHWWHHPIMCRFLYELPRIPIRMVLWVHVSGCTYPYLSYSFANQFQRIFVTSPSSLDNPYWSEEQKREIVGKVELIYGLGQLEELNKKQNYERRKEEVRIGYVGTLSASKISPRFPYICKQIINRVSDAEFYLAGDLENGAWIVEEANNLNIASRIHLLGYTQRIDKLLMSFDIFGYPLNCYHFGTTENVILEAMAVGLPIVCFKQATEQYIISHGIDGILARDETAYIEAVCSLVDNMELRKKLGEKAALQVYRKFSFGDNLRRFEYALSNIYQQQKQIVSFREVLGETPFQWMLSAMNEDDKNTVKQFDVANYPIILLGESKSSIIHFAQIYPDDVILERQRLLIERKCENAGNVFV